MRLLSKTVFRGRGKMRIVPMALCSSDSESALPFEQFYPAKNAVISPSQRDAVLFGSHRKPKCKKHIISYWRNKRKIIKYTI